MNYQQILKITYVFNLVNQFNQFDNVRQNKNNHVEIVKLEDTFYIKDANKNLYLIQNGMRNFIKIENILNTCIHFEKYKTKPMEGYSEIIKNNIHPFIQGQPVARVVQPVGSNIPFPRKSINMNLLKFMYFQYSIDKSYFDN
jgi:hypothetical protein